MTAASEPPNELYIKVPHALIDIVAKGDISPTAAWLFVILAQRVNRQRGDTDVWPSRGKLADAMGFTLPKAVDKYLAELITAKLIRKKSRARADGGDASNLYTLRFPSSDPSTQTGTRVPPAKTPKSPAQTPVPDRVHPSTQSGTPPSTQMGTPPVPNRGHHELEEVELEEVELDEVLSPHAGAAPSAPSASPTGEREDSPRSQTPDQKPKTGTNEGGSPTSRSAAGSESGSGSAAHIALAQFDVTGAEADQLIPLIEARNKVRVPAVWWPHVARNGTLLGLIADARTAQPDRSAGAKVYQTPSTHRSNPFAGGANATVASKVTGASS